MNRVTVRTPAKINLALMVGPVRADGFHELASVYHAVDLYDELTATYARRVTVQISGVGGDVIPLNRDNLAVRAAELLAERHGVQAGVSLRIRKGIPVAGGLAGGSSDAAATLVACDTLWGTHLGRTQLLSLAAELGSDVPFCVLGNTALGSGHGEVVTPVLARGRYIWVLGLAAEGMSTPEVYAELDRIRGAETPAGRRTGPRAQASAAQVSGPQVPDALMEALRSGDPLALGAALTNDLQPAAVRMRPSLREVLAVGTEHGALGSLVSGSGPTCLFLARDEEQAADIAAELRASGVCDLVRVARGPVAGARVVGTPISA